MKGRGVRIGRGVGELGVLLSRGRGAVTIQCCYF